MISARHKDCLFEQRLKLQHEQTIYNSEQFTTPFTARRAIPAKDTQNYNKPK